MTSVGETVLDGLYDTHLLDSLKTVELILLVSGRLGLEISPAELDRELWATPARIVHFIEARIPA